MKLLILFGVLALLAMSQAQSEENETTTVDPSQDEDNSSSSSAAPPPPPPSGRPGRPGPHGLGIFLPGPFGRPPLIPGPGQIIREIIESRPVGPFRRPGGLLLPRRFRE